MSSAWSDYPIHIIDFEGSQDYGVIEFGVVRLEGGGIVGCRTELCQAEGEISARDSWQHGLKRHHTEGHPFFREHWEGFCALRREGPLGAHHASVENRLLKRCWPYPPESPGFFPGSPKVADWGPWVDTRCLSEATFPQFASHQLGSLITTLDLTNALAEQAARWCPPERQRYHCALYDALASALVLLRIAEHWQAVGSPLTLEWVLEQSLPQAQRASRRQVDLFDPH